MKNALITMQHNSKQQILKNMNKTCTPLPSHDILTVKNAEQQGYAWGGDFGSFSPPEIIEAITNLVKNKGHKIGGARIVLFNEKEVTWGLYKPTRQLHTQTNKPPSDPRNADMLHKQLYKKFQALPVKNYLTVQTDDVLGYEWEFDVGKFSPPEAIPYALALVKHDGYKIGKASQWWPGREEQDRGVYKPLKPQQGKTSNQSEKSRGVDKPSPQESVRLSQMRNIFNLFAMLGRWRG